MKVHKALSWHPPKLVPPLFLQDPPTILCQYVYFRMLSRLEIGEKKNIKALKSYSQITFCFEFFTFKE